MSKVYNINNVNKEEKSKNKKGEGSMNKKYIEVFKLPEYPYPITKAEKREILEKALQSFRDWELEGTYLIVDTDGTPVGFVPSGAVFDKALLETKPLYVLCWTMDCLEEFKNEIDFKEYGIEELLL